MSRAKRIVKPTPSTLFIPSQASGSGQGLLAHVPLLHPKYKTRVANCSRLLLTNHYLAELYRTRLNIVYYDLYRVAKIIEWRKEKQRSIRFFEASISLLANCNEEEYTSLPRVS